MRFLPLLILPSAALAHPGDHSHTSPTHMLTEPDHLALLAAVVVAGVLIWRTLRGRS